MSENREKKPPETNDEAEDQVLSEEELESVSGGTITITEMEVEMPVLEVRVPKKKSRIDW